MEVTIDRLLGEPLMHEHVIADLASMTSAELAGVITDETGTGALVFATSPTLVTPELGVATATSLAVPTITTASGALTITPASGSNLNITLATTGDLAVNTNQLYVDTSAGFVGIGTTSPTAKLHIKSAGGVNSGLLTESTSASSYSTTDWKNSTGKLTQMVVTGTGYSNGMILADQANFNTNSTNGLSFVAYDTNGYITFGTGGIATSNERVRIDNLGNVGIGTTGPTDKLNIVTTAAYGGLTLESTAASNYQTALNFKHPNGTTYGRVGFDQNTDSMRIMNLSTWAGAGADILFYTNNDTTTPKVAISRAGNVGIGTTAPGKKVEINSATGDCLRLTYNDADGSAVNYTDFAVSSSGDLTITPSGGDLFISGAGSTVIGSQSALATTATTGFVYIPTSAGTPTGVPTTYTGKVAMEYDTTANKLWVYNGAWKSVTLA